MPKQKPWHILKVRQDDEICDYCYYNRLAYHRYNVKAKARPYEFEPVNPELARCVCDEELPCRDKTCSFYKRGIIDPNKKPARETGIGPNDPSVQEVIWTGRDPELLGLVTLTLVHKDLKRTKLVEYNCKGCSEKSYQLARQIRRGIKSRGLTEFFCTTHCATKYRGAQRKRENAA